MIFSTIRNFHFISFDWSEFFLLDELHVNSYLLTGQCLPTTGQIAKKKCSERELLNEAYWKIRRPK